MLTTTYGQRQNVSMMLVLSMMFSLWFTVVPVSQLQASILGSAKNIAKSIFVNVGAVAAGLAAGAVGMAVGGGPLGMAVGGVGGYIVGKKVLNWTVSSTANFATVAGAIAGGALCLGMGFPMLAVGVIGGGLVARLATKGIAKLFGKKPLLITKASIDPAAAAAESAAVGEFFANMNEKKAAAPVVAEPIAKADNSKSFNVGNSQSAYNNYVAAYKTYMEATQKGNAAIAKQSYTEYKKNLDLYNALVKDGK